jgi:hypothetical protein
MRKPYICLYFKHKSYQVARGNGKILVGPQKTDLNVVVL